MGYDFSIEYKKGKENKVAAALSRKLEEEVGILAVISIPTPLWIDELKHSYSLSQKIHAIYLRLQNGEEGNKNYSLQQGLLLRKDKRVVVLGSTFKDKILQHNHHNPQVGHVGYHKTLKRPKMDFYWK